MWLLVAREPRPDAPDWPGRRLLAAVDAVAWPLLWVLLIRQVPGPAGLVGPFVTALAVLIRRIVELPKSATKIVLAASTARPRHCPTPAARWPDT